MDTHKKTKRHASNLRGVHNTSTHKQIRDKPQSRVKKKIEGGGVQKKYKGPHRRKRHKGGRLENPLPNSKL